MKSASQQQPQQVIRASENMTEEEKIKTMFNQQAQYWETTQTQMTRYVIIRILSLFLVIAQSIDLP